MYSSMCCVKAMALLQALAKGLLRTTAVSSIIWALAAVLNVPEKTFNGSRVTLPLQLYTLRFLKSMVCDALP